MRLLLVLLMATVVAGRFKLATTGQCVDAGANHVYNEEQCIRAAGTLAATAQTPITFVNEMLNPHGCLLDPIRKIAVMNVNPGAGAACGGSYICVCTDEPSLICGKDELCYHLKFDGPEVGDSALGHYFENSNGITVVTDTAVHGKGVRVDDSTVMNQNADMGTAVPYFVPPTQIWNSAGQLSMSAWFKKESSGMQDPEYIIQMSRATYAPIAGMSIEGGFPTCFANGCKVSSMNSLVIGIWTFLSCSFDFGGTTSVSLYVADHNTGLPTTPDVSAPTCTTFTVGTEQVYIGGWKPNPIFTEHAFNGVIDDVRIYRKVLTPDEVRSAACCQGKYTPLSNTMPSNGVCPMCDTSPTATITMTDIIPPTGTKTFSKSVSSSKTDPLPTATKTRTGTVSLIPPSLTKSLSMTILPDTPTEELPTATATIQIESKTETIKSNTLTLVSVPSNTKTLATETVVVTPTLSVLPSSTMQLPTPTLGTLTLLSFTPSASSTVVAAVAFPTLTATQNETVTETATLTGSITSSRTFSLIPPSLSIEAVCERNIKAEVLANVGIICTVSVTSKEGKFRSEMIDQMEWQADVAIDNGFNWAMEEHRSDFFVAELLNDRQLKVKVGPFKDYWPSGDEQVNLKFENLLTTSTEVTGDKNITLTIQSREQIPQVGEVTTVAKSLALSPGAAKSALLLGLNCKQRGNGTVEELMDWTMHPIGLKVGGSIHVGALIFNGLLTLSFVAVHAAVAALFYFSCSPSVVSDPLASKWVHSMGAARFPSLIFLPASFLFQGNAFAAIKLIAVAETAAGVVAGCFGLSVLIAFLVFVVYLTSGDRFQATYVPDEHPPSRCTILHKLFYGLGTWASTSSCFVERWGEIFDCWKPKYKWFMVLELGHMLPLTAFAVRNMDSNDECGINALFMAGILFFYWVAITFTFPFSTPFEAICMSLEALFQMIAMIFLAIGFFSGEDRHPGFTIAGQFLEGAMWLMIIKTVYEVIRTIHDLCTGRTKRLKDAYEEDHKQLTETTDTLCQEIELERVSSQPTEESLAMDETQELDDLYSFLDRADKLGVLTPTQNLTVGTTITLAGIKNRNGFRAVVTKQLEDGRVRVRLTDGTMLKVKPVNCTIDSSYNTSFARSKTAGDWNHIIKQAHQLQHSRSANLAFPGSREDMSYNKC